MNTSKNNIMKLCVLIMIAMATLTTACGNLDDGHDDDYGYDDDYDSYDDCDSYYEECEDDSISATEAATILIILGRL